uniref:Uncharacterized protein n=1 Tax=Steinernema glaseri TaxID=37863 RepID=A0A1I8AS56_9BILA
MAPGPKVLGAAAATATETKIDQRRVEGPLKSPIAFSCCFKKKKKKKKMLEKLVQQDSPYSKLLGEFGPLGTTVESIFCIHPS